MLATFKGEVMTSFLKLQANIKRDYDVDMNFNEKGEYISVNFHYICTETGLVFELSYSQHRIDVLSTGIEAFVMASFYEYRRAANKQEKIRIPKILTN